MSPPRTWDFSVRTLLLLVEVEALSLGWVVVKQDRGGSVGYCTEAVPLEGLPGQVVRAMLLFV